MKTHTRYLTAEIQQDLEEKMVFIGGPRQVGKTTIAKELIATIYRSAYYNWDKLSSRRSAIKGEWPMESELIILDEFHKNPKWKTWLKGEFDTGKDRYKFLLTGSARMNVYRRGGDSLHGRYHYYTLHPFSVAELNAYKPTYKPGDVLDFKKDKKKSFCDLFKFGGFPEPFLKKDERFLRRWQTERTEIFFKEDVRELTMIKDYAGLTLLADLLPDRVSSILSINSLAEDLQINYRTAARWLDTFDQLYYCFRIASYQTKKVKAVRKEKKLYLWDWALARDDSKRLENMVASHLLKFCDYMHDSEGYKVGLTFLRDSTGREVDFLVTHDGKPWFAVEVKMKDESIPKNMLYFKKKLSIPYNFLVTNECDTAKTVNGINIISAQEFLTALV